MRCRTSWTIRILTALSEGRPTTPTQRPASARPRRGDVEAPAPPSRAELEAIERGIAGLSELAGARVQRDRSLGSRIVTWPGHGPAFNYGIGIRWTDEDWRASAARLAARLRVAAEMPAVVVTEGLTEPRDLHERLASAGWRETASEIVCWTRRAATVPHLDPTLRIQALTVPAVPEYEAVEREIFGLDPFTAAERAEALRRGVESGRLRGYLLRLRGEPVAITRLVHLEGLACLSGVGVRAPRRGGGLGALITTVATRAGLAMGSPLVWLSVDPGNEPAWRLYAGLDYRPAFRWHRLVEPLPE